MHTGSFVPMATVRFLPLSALPATGMGQFLSAGSIYTFPILSFAESCSLMISSRTHDIYSFVCAPIFSDVFANGSTATFLDPLRRNLSGSSSLEILESIICFSASSLSIGAVRHLMLISEIICAASSGFPFFSADVIRCLVWSSSTPGETDESAFAASAYLPSLSAASYRLILLLVLSARSIKSAKSLPPFIS